MLCQKCGVDLTAQNQSNTFSSAPCPKCGHTSTDSMFAAPAHKMNETEINQLQAKINAELTGQKIPDQMAQPRPAVANPEEISRPRPWLRFWAVNFDALLLMIIFLPAGFLLKKFTGAAFDFKQEIWGGLTGKTIHEILLSVIQFLTMVICLAYFQTTPGKALFNIKIKMASGQRISLMNSLRRSLWLSLFMTLPMLPLLINGALNLTPLATVATGLAGIVFSLAAPIVYYFKLKKEGITPWDRKAGFVIEHHPISDKRQGLIIALYLIMLIIVIAWVIWSVIMQLNRMGASL